MTIAITGGIGSGKSYICRMLAKHGIEVYDCDARAKQLMLSSPRLQLALNELVGEKVFDEGGFHKAILATFLLKSARNKQAVNDVVHPFVAEDFKKSGLKWLESAILFESNFHQRIHIDKVVCVSAPIETRTERVMRRDGIPRQKAREWIEKQMPQEEIIARSDFNIPCVGTDEEKEARLMELLKALCPQKYRTRI